MAAAEQNRSVSDAWQSPGTWALLRRSLTVVSNSNISRMAAALSYRTVFGLIPVLAIGVAVLGGFATDQQVEETITRILEFTALDDIVIAPEAEPEAQAKPEPRPEAGKDLPEQSTETEAKLDEWLKKLVAKVRGVSFVAIGLTGLMVLIYAALSFMVEIERSANHIYRAPIGRSWVRRVTQYWTTLTLGSIFLVGTFYVGQSFQVLLAPDKDSLAAALAGNAVSVLISFLLLMALYVTIPNSRVSLKCAAIGAGFAAVLWGVGKWAFSFFVLFSKVSVFYGTLALLPLFLLWVYITWIIVLFGLQISYVLQYYRAFAIPEQRRDGPVLVDSLTVVRVAAMVAECFSKGATARVGGVAKRADLDEDVTLAILEQLTKAGVLHEVPIGGDAEGFSMAKPAEEITIEELLEAARRISDHRPEEGYAGSRLDALRRVQIEAAAGMRLRDLLPSAESSQTETDRSGAAQVAADPSAS